MSVDEPDSTRTGQFVAFGGSREQRSLGKRIAGLSGAPFSGKVELR